MRDSIKDTITVRQAIPALRTGTYEPILAQGGVLAYLRRDELDTVLVVLNNSNQPVKFDLPTGNAFEDGAELQDQLSESHYTITQQQVKDLSVPAMGALILA